MKTANFIRIFFVTLLVILIAGISSYAFEPAAAPAIQIQKLIKDNIKYPEQAVKNCCTGSVDVLFSIDAEGKIKIEKTFAENAHVEKMVKDQLASVCCKAIKVPFNEHYKIRITFKLIG